jgi:hypothetical protein
MTSPTTTYTVLIRYRDTGTLANDGIQLSDANEVSAYAYNPEGMPFYFLVKDTTLTEIEATKIVKTTCGPAFTSAVFSPGHDRVLNYNFFDVTFTPSITVPAAGYVMVEFPTHNELAKFFPIDLGQSTTSIDCGLTTPSAATCTLTAASAYSPTTPAYVKVTGHGGFTAATAYTIRMARVKNPVNGAEGIHGDYAIDGDVRFYTVHADGNYGVRYNELLDYRVFRGGLRSTSPTAKTSATMTSTVTTTYTLASSMSFTFDASTLTVDNSFGDSFILVLDSAFLLPTTGTNDPTCSAYAGAVTCMVFGTANWVVVQTSSTGFGTVGGRSLTLEGSSAFKTYTQPGGYSVSAYAIDGTGLRLTTQH